MKTEKDDVVERLRILRASANLDRAIIALEETLLWVKETRQEEGLQED